MRQTLPPKLLVRVHKSATVFVSLLVAVRKYLTKMTDGRTDRWTDGKREERFLSVS